MTTEKPRLALQRCLSGDRGRWRTVGRIKLGYERRAMAACLALAETIEPIKWRIVRDDNLQTVLREFESPK